MMILTWFKNLFKPKKQPIETFKVTKDNKTTVAIVIPPNTQHISSLTVVRGYAQAYFWKEIDLQVKPPMISFQKGAVRLNVYYTTMTVGTCLNHPIKGKTQLFRRNLKWAEIEKIFINPRTHSGKGYYKK